MFQQMLKKSIYKSQKCQRNWDLSKDIPKEDVDVTYLKTLKLLCII